MSSKLKNGTKPTPKLKKDPRKPDTLRKIKEENKPSSPSSQSIKKTEYYPSKNIYKTALKNEKPVKNTPKPKKKTPTDEPDRPGTATLRKGSIVNSNIVGPEAPKYTHEYEDDFDSYESDFEQVTSDSISEISTEGTSSSSSEEIVIQRNSAGSREEIVIQRNSAGSREEKKLDSGNFDLIKREFNSKIETVKSNMTSLSDEGFEESLQIINFLGAKKKYERDKSAELKRKRGEEILSMIKLDTINFTLFELQSVPYEEYIKSFGKSNNVQVSCQTGEDLIVEEVQTDPIVSKTKWCQMPPRLNFESNWEVYKSELVGVGEDEPGDYEIKYDEDKLKSFLEETGSVVINLLQELRKPNALINSEDIISKKYIEYKFSNILNRAVVTKAAFCNFNPTLFLTIHVDHNKSTLCIWNINNTEKPDFYLSTYGIVTCCCFALNSSSIIIAGLDNGCIAVWDVKNCRLYDEENFIIPSHITKIGYGHHASLISIHSVQEIEDKFAGFCKAKQICSADCDGTINLWTLIRINHTESLVEFGKIHLTISAKLSLAQVQSNLTELICFDMITARNMLLATNYGPINCTIEGHPNVKIFESEKIPAQCISKCPFSDLYFLVGYKDGSISLYSVKILRPLLTMSNKENESENAIETIQWSKEKPCTFLTRTANNLIDVWDLSKTTLFPIATIPFQENVTSLRLMTERLDGVSSNLIITTKSKIQMHLFQINEPSHDKDTYEKEIKTFLNFVNRL